MTLTDLVVDAVGKYIGIDTSYEDGVIGVLVTQRRVTDEIQDRLNTFIELFLTYIEYFFLFSQLPKTIEEKKAAIAKYEHIYPKFLGRFEEIMQYGGKIGDILKAVPDEDLNGYDQTDDGE